MTPSNPSHRPGASTGSTVALVVIALAAIGGVIWYAFLRPEPPCIQPPQLSDASQNGLANEIAGKLEKVKASANLKSEFEAVARAEYDKLSDANVTLLLFLRAIDCYHKHGKAADPTVKEMVSIVRELARSCFGISGGLTPELSPLERQKISESPDSQEILQKLDQLGGVK